jgi:RIO-like serine/threonine protein kinase
MQTSSSYYVVENENTGFVPHYCNKDRKNNMTDLLSTVYREFTYFLWMGVIYSDFKTENVLLDCARHATVTDYRL